MPSQESITDAKANFVAALKDGIDVLMERCGYSRERASSALLRELSRGVHVRPNDHEVFETMKRHQLGIDEVTKALTVSKVFRRAMESCASPAEAIQSLSRKISVRNLMYESSDEDPSVCDQDCTIRPELRIEPVSGLERQTSSRTKAASMRKMKGSLKNNKSKSKTPTKGGLAGRKRSIDELSSTCLPSRERSDSVSVQVDAKIAKKSSDEVAGNDALRTSAGVRTKRSHRTEEPDASVSPTSHKRVRGIDG